MDFNSFKEIVVAQCKALGITEYELYYQAGSSVSVEAFQHGINEFSASQSGGVCFRCIVNGKMGYASTEALTEEQAKAVVAKAADSAALLEAEEQVFLGESVNAPSLGSTTAGSGIMEIAEFASICSLQEMRQRNAIARVV